MTVTETQTSWFDRVSQTFRKQLSSSNYKPEPLQTTHPRIHRTKRDSINSDGSYERQSSLDSARSCGSSSSTSSVATIHEPRGVAQSVIDWIESNPKSPITNRRYNLVEFIEHIRPLFYAHVSLGLLPEWFDANPEPTNDEYLTYLLYFLKYARQYHRSRVSTHITHKSRIEYHKCGFHNIQAQIKYVCDYYKRSISPALNGSITEVTL